MSRTLWRILVAAALYVILFASFSYAQRMHNTSDPHQIGPFAVGHTSYTFTDVSANDRPVFVSVWYPVDPEEINAQTPVAEYLTDPYSGTQHLPATHSTDWEALGYDPAFEHPRVSSNGRFPLFIMSHGWGASFWSHLFVGTRLASHGYVVGVIQHWDDCQWTSSEPCKGVIASAANRPRDVSFAITKLLSLNDKRGELLFHAIDQSRIAVGGASLGGYAAYALTGGDKTICDALWPAAMGMDKLPYPAEACVATTIDPRIKAMISLDGASWLLHYRELANISVPSLLLSESVDKWGTQWPPDMRATAARTHAAIDREDSHRVDVNGAVHMSFLNQCDAMQVWSNLGWTYSNLPSFPCAMWTAELSSKDANAVISKYMIAFLNTYLGHPDDIDHWILSPEYALTHSPTVQSFDDEHCKAEMPDHTYFRYRPYQQSSACEVAPKDPSWYFPMQQ